jgi:hypothetical protein
MNNASLTATKAALLIVSLSSSQITPAWALHYDFYNNMQLTQTEMLAQISTAKNIDAALNLFEGQRNFTAEESAMYEQGLSKLFVKTGRKVF